MTIGKIVKYPVALIMILLGLVTLSMAQENQEKKYPKGYFRNPLGIPISLSANFGELRQTHWHMGLDIRTNQRENYNVYAAADGFVARIGIEPFSFGHFIVIRHPNGYSTLYAHMNEFYPQLEAYVRSKQTEKESWAIELAFNEKQFPVKKGDRIGLSGNTGGSQGPHLHFEIRDTKTDKCLNPLLFGMDVKDNVPPDIRSLALYDRSTSTYFQKPQLFSVRKTGNHYTLNTTIIITGLRKISFAIASTDRVNGFSGPNGIYRAVLYLDEKPQLEYKIDNIDYDETDYVNAHVDKKYRNDGGMYLQHLSKLPGFEGTVYLKKYGDGIITLNDESAHLVKIRIYDAYNNLSELSFSIRHSTNKDEKNNKSGTIKVLIPRQVNIIEEKDFEVFMPEISIYDSIPLVRTTVNNMLPGSVSASYRLCDPSYPLNRSINIRIRPTNNIPDSSKEKLVMVSEWKDEKTIKKANWQNGWVAASFSDFGSFQLFEDHEPPEINAPGRGSDTLDLSEVSRIVFTPKDNSGIGSFRAELDDKWLMFTNDKARSFLYTFDEQCPYGFHKLKVRIEDIVGNVTEKIWWFKREPYAPSKKK